MSTQLDPWYAVSLMLCSLWLHRQRAQCVSELDQTISQRTRQASRHAGEYKYVEIDQLQYPSISYIARPLSSDPAGYTLNPQLQF